MSDLVITQTVGFSHAQAPINVVIYHLFSSTKSLSSGELVFFSSSSGSDMEIHVAEL